MPRSIEPFSGQRVYVDISDGNCRRNLEDSLRRLGAIVHVFLMENVNIIITDNLTKYGTPSKQQSLRNEKELRSFGSRVESKATNMKYINKSSCDVTWKGTSRIMSLDEAHHHIHLANNICGGERHLKSSFIKVDFIDGHFCPIFNEFSGSWPPLKVNVSNCSFAVSSHNLPNISTQKSASIVHGRDSFNKKVISIKKSCSTRSYTDKIDEKMSSSNGFGVENCSSSKCSTRFNAQCCSDRTSCISCKIAVSRIPEKSGVVNCLFNNLTKLILALTRQRAKSSHASPQHQLCGQVREGLKCGNDSTVICRKIKKYIVRNNAFKIVSSDLAFNSLIQDIVLHIIHQNFNNFQAVFVQTSLILITSNILQEMMKFMKLGKSPWSNVKNLLRDTIPYETQQTMCYKSVVKMCVEERRNFRGSVTVFEIPEKRPFEKSVLAELSDYTKFPKIKCTRKRTRDLWMEHSEDSLPKRCKYDNELENMAHSKTFQIHNRNKILAEKKMQYKREKFCNVQDKKPSVMKFHDLQSSKTLTKGMILENVLNPAPDVPGYCEICQCKCVSIRNHIGEPSHATFYLKSDHFQVLDQYISTVNSSSIFKNFRFSRI